MTSISETVHLTFFLCVGLTILLKTQLTCSDPKSTECALFNLHQRFCNHVLIDEDIMRMHELMHETLSEDTANGITRMMMQCYAAIRSLYQDPALFPSRWKEFLTSVSELQCRGDKLILRFDEASDVLTVSESNCTENDVVVQFTNIGAHVDRWWKSVNRSTGWRAGWDREVLFWNICRSEPDTEETRDLYQRVLYVSVASGCCFLAASLMYNRREKKPARTMWITTTVWPRHGMELVFIVLLYATARLCEGLSRHLEPGDTLRGFMASIGLHPLSNYTALYQFPPSTALAYAGISWYGLSRYENPLRVYLDGMLLCALALTLATYTIELSPNVRDVLTLFTITFMFHTHLFRNEEEKLTGSRGDFVSMIGVGVCGVIMLFVRLDGNWFLVPACAFTLRRGFHERVDWDWSYVWILLAYSESGPDILAQVLTGTPSSVLVGLWALFWLVDVLCRGPITATLMVLWMLGSLLMGGFGWVTWLHTCGFRFRGLILSTLVSELLRHELSVSDGNLRDRLHPRRLVEYARSRISRCCRGRSRDEPVQTARRRKRSVVQEPTPLPPPSPPVAQTPSVLYTPPPVIPVFEADSPCAACRSVIRGESNVKYYELKCIFDHVSFYHTSKCFRDRLGGRKQNDRDTFRFLPCDHAPCRGTIYSAAVCVDGVETRRLDH